MSLAIYQIIGFILFWGGMVIGLGVALYMTFDALILRPATQSKVINIGNVPYDFIVFFEGGKWRMKLKTIPRGKTVYSGSSKYRFGVWIKRKELEGGK